VTNPLSFSVSVPVGAWHPFLRDCLSSLAAQKGPKQIALLDASGDRRVKQIADEFDALFAYRRHGPDGGQSAAILEGWAKTDGDILAWLNADDILFPGAFEAARAALEDGAHDVVYGHSTILDDDKRTTGYHWAVEEPGPRLLEGGIISQPSCFFRRSAYDKSGGLNADLHYTMDWDLWIRLYKSGAKFSFIDKTLSMVLWAEGTKTSSFNKTRRDELSAIIQQHAPPQSTKKIMRSFAIQNIVERLRPARLKTLVTRSLIRGRRKIYGISGDGRIHDGARLAMTHYEKDPKTSVLIRAENTASIEAVLMDGAGATLNHIDNATLRATFAAPVSAATPAGLTFKISSGRPVYFQTCLFQNRAMGLTAAKG